MPDLEVTASSGEQRVYELLHDARPLLLNLGAPGSVNIAGWADRIRLTEASHQGEWELPVIGVVTAPTAVLVRSDGYVGWAGNGAQQGLTEALTIWCGPPTAGRCRGVPSRRYRCARSSESFTLRRGC
jgi:3-(3-hydroxy-phenyl)propionate hydroxylase